MNELPPRSLPGLSQVEATIQQSISSLERKLSDLSNQLEVLQDATKGSSDKDRYTTSELSQVMGVTGHTVRERWCNQGRIECEKDPANGKWRIPGREFDRLRRGGRPSAY